MGNVTNRIMTTLQMLCQLSVYYWGHLYKQQSMLQMLLWQPIGTKDKEQ